MIGIFLIIATVAGLGIALTDTGRTMAKSVVGLFITDAMKNPKMAEGVYMQAIEEAQKQYSIASDTLSQLTGSLVETKVNFDKVETELSSVESKCERLAKNNDMDGLSILASKRNLLITKKDTYYNRMLELKPLVEEAQGIHTNWESKINQLKNDKELRITELELSTSMNSLYSKMDNLRKDTATDKLLGKVEDNIEKSKRLAVGNKMVHDNKIETKEQKLNKKLSNLENDDYIQSLLNKNK